MASTSRAHTSSATAGRLVVNQNARRNADRTRRGGGAGGSSDIAQLERLAERAHRVARGDELLGEVAGEALVRDGLADGGVLELLGLVELVAAGDAAGVVVADVLEVVGDRADHVALHDLHVVDVVEELEAGRGDGLDQLDPP